MNNLQEMDQHMVKEEHSQVFTLRSIDSSQQMLEFVPVYYRHSQSNGYKSGHWSAKEHIKYVMFLDYFANIFTVKHNIKLWKIFTIMSTFIKTRNSSQCRSHHQKTQRKYNSIEQILRIQRAKYRNYENQYQKMKQSLAKLPIHNPLEMEVKFQSIEPVPSLKILQEDIQHLILRNSVSLVDMNELDKSQKSRKNIGSQKIIHYPSQKYIASQVSIEMEHQNDVLSQQRIQQLMYEELQVDYEKEKQFWLFQNSQGDNSQRKDQKFDRTADSILMDANNKTLSQQKPKHDSLPEKQSANNEQDLIPTGQTIIISTNLVRKKRSRTRSLLPSYDIVENQGKAHPSQFYKESKKNQLYTPEGKCKTLPPRSFKDQNEQSQPVQKVEQKQPVGKSFFSGFVSSLDSENKGINDRIDHEQQSNQKDNCEDVSSKYEQIKPKVEQNQRNDSQMQQKQNIFFCDYGGNIYNQNSYGQQGEHEDSYNYLPKKTIKGKQKQQEFQTLKVEKSKMNFTKKGSQQIESAFKQQQDIRIKECQQNSQGQSNNNHQQILHNNSLDFYNQYMYNQQYHPIDYQTFYNPYFIQHQHQYSLLQHNYQQFIYFYIYFLMQKIQMSHIFYEPN